MHKWLRSKPRVVGFAAYWILRTLRLSLRIRVYKHPNIDPTQPYLFAFWHGKQLLLTLVLHQHHKSPLCALVSPSRDGEMLTVYLEKSGFEVIRGSSRNNNVAALINIKKKLLQGTSVGFGVDGPIGPLHVIKPGIIFMAKKCNMQIIPMGSAFSRSWIFHKAWDKFQLPKPFANAAFVLGQPYTVPKDIDIDQACAELAQILHQTEQQATDLI